MDALHPVRPDELRHHASRRLRVIKAFIPGQRTPQLHRLLPARRGQHHIGVRRKLPGGVDSLEEERGGNPIPPGPEQRPPWPQPIAIQPSEPQPAKPLKIGTDRPEAHLPASIHPRPRPQPFRLAQPPFPRKQHFGRLGPPTFRQQDLCQLCMRQRREHSLVRRWQPGRGLRQSGRQNPKRRLVVAVQQRKPFRDGHGAMQDLILEPVQLQPVLHAGPALHVIVQRPDLSLRQVHAGDSAIDLLPKESVGYPRRMQNDFALDLGALYAKVPLDPGARQVDAPLN